MFGEVELKHNFKAAINVKGPWRAHKYSDSVSLSKRSPSTDSKSLKLHNSTPWQQMEKCYSSTHPTPQQHNASALWKPQQHYRWPQSAIRDKTAICFQIKSSWELRQRERVRENKDASHLRLSRISFPQWDRGSFLLPEGGWMWHRGRAVPWQRSSNAGDRCSSWAQPPWHLGLQLLTAHFPIAQHSLVRDGPLLFKKEKWNGGRLNKLEFKAAASAWDWHRIKTDPHCRGFWSGTSTEEFQP